MIKLITWLALSTFLIPNRILKLMQWLNCVAELFLINWTKAPFIWVVVYIWGIPTIRWIYIESHKHELNILDSLCTYYSNFGNVIIAGDLNAQDHDRSNKYKSIELTKFIDRQFLSYAGNQIPFKGPNYTYTTKETMSDYILFNQGVISQLRPYEILSEGSVSSTSDHLPIVVKIKLDYNPHRLSYSYMKSPAWQKINDKNLKNYQEFLNDPLDFLLERMNYANPNVDTLNNDLVTILKYASSTTIPHCGYNLYTKSYWNFEVRNAHNEERYKRRCWVADGRPRGMHFESYRDYKRSKSNFRNVQHTAYEKYIQKTYDDINDAAECDIRLFWKLIKKQ